MFILFYVNYVFKLLVNLGLGGPAVGDIRSRCLRLSDQSTAEALAVRRLLGHRLPLDAQQAKSEWYYSLHLSFFNFVGLFPPPK